MFAISAELVVHFDVSPMANGACKLLEYLIQLSLAANIFCHITIAVDRYRNVVRPLLPKFTRQQCAISLAVVWLAAAVHASWAAIGFQAHSDYFVVGGRQFVRSTCELSNSRLSRSLIWYNMTLVYIAPLSLLTLLYSRLLVKLKTTKNKVLPSVGGRHRHQQRVIKMLIAIITAFAICQLPLHVWYIVVYCHSGPFLHYLIVYQILDLVSFTNCWLNVAIYVMFNDNFRRAFWRAVHNHGLHKNNNTINGLATITLDDTSTGGDGRGGAGGGGTGAVLEMTEKQRVS